MDQQILTDLKNQLIKEFNEAGECFIKQPSQNLNYSIYILLKNIKYLNTMLDSAYNMDDTKKGLWN